MANKYHEIVGPHLEASVSSISVGPFGPFDVEKKHFKVPVEALSYFIFPGSKYKLVEPEKAPAPFKPAESGTKEG